MRTGRKSQYEQRLFCIGIIVLAAAIFFQFLVNQNLTLYSDDYWYGTFFRDGWDGFIANTIEHYQTTNGRVWVHILIPILLLKDTRIFAFVSPVFTALIVLLGLRVQDKRLGRGTLILGTGLGLLSVLGSEIQYLRMTLYWLAAYFNYVFPLLLPLIVLWGMERGEQGDFFWPDMIWMGLCVFLAGSSTEQCGVIALILIWGFWLLRIWNKSERQGLLSLCPLLTALGYLTILMAPGSHARIERGISGGILSVLNPTVFLSRFFDVMHYLCGYSFWNVLFGLFCLLVALLSLKDGKLPRHLCSGFPAAALVLFLSVFGCEAPLAVLTVCYTLYVAITLLFVPELQITGLMLLGGGASVMMLLVTTLYYARTFFPCVLLLLIICWSLLLRLLRDWPQAVSGSLLVLLAGICLVRYVPIYQGYADNKRVINRNLQAIENYKTGEELVLSIDLKADYRFTMFFEGYYFLNNFLKYYEIPQDAPIRFTSEEWDIYEVEVNGQHSIYPALQKGEDLLIPLEFVFQSRGESCYFDWSDHTYTITNRGNIYTLFENGKLFLHGTDGKEILMDEACNIQMPFSYTYTLLYLSEKDFERCFDISFDVNQETGTCIQREN